MSRFFRFVIFLVIIGLLVKYVIPWKNTVKEITQTNFHPAHVSIIYEKEDPDDNWFDWKLLSIKEKISVWRNYIAFHTLTQEEKIKVIHNYIDWIRLEPEEKALVIEKYKSGFWQDKCKPKSKIQTTIIQ
ncbi:MAG: hypothetical protein NC825_04925 [Candidatus Omnitrophica bacterium]|nr:hypothetical protein [Candidatus Omnitrophota bacterium]